MSGIRKVLAGAREYLMAGVNLWARHLAVELAGSMAAESAIQKAANLEKAKA